MKLGDLTSTDVGKTITIEGKGDSITGTLVGVDHFARVSSDRRLMDATPKYEVGPAMVEVSILGWGEREYRPTTECTLDGPKA